jgi:hypothetical protein
MVSAFAGGDVEKLFEIFYSDKDPPDQCCGAGAETFGWSRYMKFRLWLPVPDPGQLICT